jgi:hypothetical protein
MKLAGEALESSCLFHRVQVGTLEILDDGDFHRLLVGDLAEDGGDCGFAGKLRGAPASLAGDELEAATGEGPDEDRLDDAVGDDGGGQLGKLIFIDLRTGLEGVAVNLAEGNFAWLAAFSLDGNGGGSLHARKQGVQSFAEGAAFAVKWGDGHDSKILEVERCLPDLSLIMASFCWK